ncbi:MAG: hypothetical protein WCI55_02175 [Armatimonadota bacterium]
MTNFDRLTAYAKQRVDVTETPISLIVNAQRKKDAIDIVFTVLIASMMLGVATQLTNSASVQSPAIKRIIQQELLTSRTNQ